MMVGNLRSEQHLASWYSISYGRSWQEEVDAQVTFLEALKAPIHHITLGRQEWEELSCDPLTMVMPMGGTILIRHPRWPSLPIYIEDEAGLVRVEADTGVAR